MTHRLRPFTPLILAFLVVAGGLSAQSVSLPFFQNGSVVRVQSSLSAGERFGVAVGAGYSIAGVLDLGLRYGADVAVSEATITSDVGMYYSYAAVKQSERVPLAVEVLGSYSFRGQSSDFLTRNRLIHEARGYTLGIALVRDSFFGQIVGVRTAGLVEYENYLETTTVGFDPTGFTGTADVDYAEYPRVERLSGFAYGAYIGVMFRTARGGAFLLGSSLLLDPDLGIEVRPDIQILMSR